MLDSFYLQKGNFLVTAKKTHFLTWLQLFYDGKVQAEDENTRLNLCGGGGEWVKYKVFKFSITLGQMLQAAAFLLGVQWYCFP